jgi:hypothetical protein
MTIIPGLVGPKARAKAVVDGQPVNIPAPKYCSMEGRILVVLAHYWICVGALRRLDRKIRPALLQGASGIPRSRGRTRMSRVPGKTSKIINILSVLKTDTGRLGE